MQTVEYRHFCVPEVCSSEITVSIREDKTIEKVDIKGGCSGYRNGIIKLVTGMKADEVIARLSSVKCDGNPWSCPMQLAVALQTALDKLERKLKKRD